MLVFEDAIQAFECFKHLQKSLFEIEQGNFYSVAMAAKNQKGIPKKHPTFDCPYCFGKIDSKYSKGTSCPHCLTWVFDDSKFIPCGTDVESASDISEIEQFYFDMVNILPKIGEEELKSVALTITSEFRRDNYLQKKRISTNKKILFGSLRRHRHIEKMYELGIQKLTKLLADEGYIKDGSTSDIPQAV